MEKEDKHLDGDGLGKVWAKIKAQYLAKTGGTLTGKLTISSGGLEVTGDSRFHDNLAVSGAISEGGTLISTKYTYTEGSYVSITDNAISVKEASSSQGGVVTNGAQTFGGVKTFLNTGDQQVILKYNGGGNSHIGLGFANSDGFNSEIYVNANSNDAPYYKKSGGTAYEMYHAGNVNISTKSWVCNNLTFYGTLQPNGNNTQDIGGQNNVVNYLYVNNIVTPGGNGIRFGVNNGDFRFYGSRLSFTDIYKLFTIKKAGGVQVHKGSLEVENGNIMASGGVAAGGIADLSNVSDDKMPKYHVQNQTAEGSNITLMRYYDAPTYQAVEFSGSSVLRISNTIPTGEQTYTGYPRYMRIHNATSGTRQIAINFTCVTDKKSISLDSGKYVEIMFFETDNYMTAKWSEIMTNQ